MSACVAAWPRFVRRGSAAGKTRAEPPARFRERGRERGRMSGHPAPVSRAVDERPPLFARDAGWTPTASAPRAERKPRRRLGRGLAGRWFSTVSIEPREKREEGTSLRGEEGRPSHEPRRAPRSSGRRPSPRRWFWVGTRRGGRYNRARSRRAKSASETERSWSEPTPNPSEPLRTRRRLDPEPARRSRTKPERSPAGQAVGHRAGVGVGEPRPVGRCP